MFTEDLTAFFDLDGFAEQATGVNAFNEPVSFPVIFDAPGSVAAGGLYGMASSKPSATTASINVIDEWDRWELTIKGIQYAVVEHKPDGTGVSVLVLEALP